MQAVNSGFLAVANKLLDSLVLTFWRSFGCSKIALGNLKFWTIGCRYCVCKSFVCCGIQVLDCVLMKDLQGFKQDFATTVQQKKIIDI